MGRMSRVARLLIFAMAVASAPLFLAAGAVHSQDGTSRWTGSWASSQQIPEPHNALAPDQLDGATLRQIVRLSLAGSRIRVRVSNVFGTTPLHVVSAHVARPVSLHAARIDPATDRALTFDGQPDVVIPAGAEYVSDPLDYPVAALSSLAVSLYVADTPAPQTSHPGSRATSYLLPGDLTAAADLPGATTVDHWYALSGVDVEGRSGGAAIAVLGDSITDGYGVAPNTNARWTDVLAQRLQGAEKTAHLSVLNHGLGGNRLLLDGLGPNALARFERDVLAQTGVRYLIVLEGVNDLGTLTRDQPTTPEQHAALVRQVTGAYAQMIARARARGVTAIGGTIMPFRAWVYYHPDAETEADRQAINAWIRAPGNFDAVIDFDAAMRDPEQPDQLRPEYDNDHLHPSIAGYRAMAEAVPLSLFQ